MSGGVHRLAGVLGFTSRILMFVVLVKFTPDVATYAQMYQFAGFFIALGTYKEFLTKEQLGERMLLEVFTDLVAFLLILIAGILEYQGPALPSFFVPYNGRANSDWPWLILAWLVAGLGIFVGGGALLVHITKSVLAKTDWTHAGGAYSHTSSSEHHSHAPIRRGAGRV